MKERAKERFARPALLVAGLLLACLAESTGPAWILAAMGSSTCFLLLLAVNVRSEAAERREARLRRELTVSTPAAFPLEEGASGAGGGPCAAPPGWASVDAALPAPVPRQGCRVP